MKYRFGYSSKTRHPCLIVGSDKNYNYSLTIMRNPSGNDRVKKFNNNPDRDCKSNQYWELHIRPQKKENFIDYSKWKLSKKDKKEIKYFVKSKHFN